MSTTNIITYRVGTEITHFLVPLAHLLLFHKALGLPFVHDYLDEHESEVALLLEQIELEYQGAANGLHGLAEGSTRHEVINTKMEHIGGHLEQLKTLVGEEQALKLVTETMNHAGNARTESPHNQTP